MLSFGLKDVKYHPSIYFSWHLIVGIQLAINQHNATLIDNSHISNSFEVLDCSAKPTYCRWMMTSAFLAINTGQDRIWLMRNFYSLSREFLGVDVRSGIAINIYFNSILHGSFYLG